MASGTTNVDLSKIEGAISTIEQNTNNLVSNASSSDSNLKDILSALQTLDNNITGNKNNKKGSNINASGLTNTLKAFNSVNPKLQTFSTNLNDVNRGLRALSTTLSKFSVNFSGNVGRATHKPTANSIDYTTNLDSLQTVLEEIKTEVAAFHANALSGFTSGNTQNSKQSTKKQPTAMSAATGQTKTKQDEREQYKKRYNAKRVTDSIVNPVTNFAKGNLKVDNIASSISSALGMIPGVGGPIAQGAFNLVKAVTDIIDKEQGAGRDYARTYGGGKYGMRQYMQESQNFRFAMPSTYGFTAEEYSKAMAGMADMTGRGTYRRSNEDVKSAIGLKRMGIEGEALGMFDTFGQSMQSMDTYFGKLYGKAGKSGLSFKKMTDAIKNNLKLAQTYTFSKGIDGLQKMAETSTRLKYNMSEVAKLADKVSTVEGATKAAANLSVLGGEFTQFANPMGMLYEGLNDFEGLNDRMVKMFSDMAYWDKERRQINISGFDRQRIKAASEAMGVDASQMMNIAMNSQREKMVESQVGSKYSGETLDYIKNLAQINKEGKAYISDTQGILGEKGAEILLNDPRFQKLIPSLKTESENKANKEKASMGDIFLETRTIYDFLEQNLAGVSGKLQALVARFVTKGAMTASQEGYLSSIQGTKEYNDLLEQYGSKKEIKHALARGELNSKIDEYVGGENIRKFIDEQKGPSFNPRTYVTALHDENSILHEAKVKEAEDWIKKKQEEEQPKEAFGSPSIATHANGGIKNYELEAGEAVLSRDTVRRFGVDNIKAGLMGADPFAAKVSNIVRTEVGGLLRAMKVAPTAGQSVSNTATKVSFEPININLTGKFDLGGKQIQLDDAMMRKLKELIFNTVNENIPNIMRKANILTDKGYVKENDPYRGTFPSSYLT